jgi:hypothetical protein
MFNTVKPQYTGPIIAQIVIGYNRASEKCTKLE